MKRLCGLIVVAAFVAVGCNRAQQPAPAAFTPTPHGSLLQVMRALPFPLSNIVFDMQNADPGAPPAKTDGTGNATSQYGSIPEYAGWNAIVTAGVGLQETANLILIPGRKCGNGQPVPVEQEDFKKWAMDLSAIGGEVQKFGEAKTYNEDAVLELAGKLSDACAACHDKYRNTPKEPEDRCMVTAATAAAQ